MRPGRGGGRKRTAEGVRRGAFGGLLALATLAFTPPLIAQPQPADDALARRITAVLDDEAFAEAFWGVLAVDLATGDTLYARHVGRRFIPASNLKLFTTAAALALLGSDFHYTTRLYLDGVVRSDTLHGDLVIRGAGDPTFGGGLRQDDDSFAFDPLAPFVAWADSLRALGIAHVTGSVVGDDDVFDDVPYGLGWAWDDFVYGYAAEVSGLTFHEGTVDLTVRGTATGRPAALAWEPVGVDYVTLDNRSVTGAAGSRVDEGYARELSGNRFTITTAVPADGADTERLAIHNPTLYTAHTFRRVLLARGIGVDEAAEDLDDRAAKPRYDRLRRVASTVSAPLAEIVAVTNTQSHNLYAEHLLRTLGARFYTGDEAHPGSVEAGVQAMRGVLINAGIDDPRELRMYDGSGLSFMNRVTPAALVRLLTHLHRHPDAAVRAAFFDSLPVGGESGTLERRFREGRARGNVRAKTGYVSSARTLSGVVTDRRGHPIAFALLCNSYAVPTSRVNAAQDEIVERLARYGD